MAHPLAEFLDDVRYYTTKVYGGATYRPWHSSDSAIRRSWLRIARLVEEYVTDASDDQERHRLLLRLVSEFETLADIDLDKDSAHQRGMFALDELIGVMSGDFKRHPHLRPIWLAARAVWWDRMPPPRAHAGWKKGLSMPDPGGRPRKRVRLLRKRRRTF